MSTLGREPARRAINAADIPDNSINASKIIDGTISAADVSSDLVTLTGSQTLTNKTLTSVTGSIASSMDFPTGKFIPLKGITRSDGGNNASGSNVDMLSISLDLTGYQDYLLYAWAHTAISENSNTGNTCRLRIKLHQGVASPNDKYFASQRTGTGAHTDNINWSSNMTSMISCQGYFVIDSTFARSCVLYMNGGIDGTAFSWGDQVSYSNFDGEDPNCGGTLGFMLFHP